MSSPGAGTIIEVTMAGVASVLARGLGEPYGMSQDSAGNVLVADWAAQKVKRISPDGVISDFASVTGQLGNVFVDGEDTVYLPHFYAGRLDTITADGTRNTVAQLPANEGFHGVLLDDAGNLYGGMVESGVIYRIFTDGTYEELARVPRRLANILWFRGYLLATGLESRRLFRISTSGEVEIFAGAGTRGSRDGPAAEAQFVNPNGLAVSPDATAIYISESGGRVRALSIEEVPLPSDAGAPAGRDAGIAAGRRER